MSDTCFSGNQRHKKAHLWEYKIYLNNWSEKKNEKYFSARN